MKRFICGSCDFRVTVPLLSTAAHHLLELLVRQAVELYDELAVGGRDLGAGVDDLDDVQLLPQAHLSAHLPTQVLDVLHLSERRKTDGRTDPCQTQQGKNFAGTR